MELNSISSQSFLNFILTLYFFFFFFVVVFPVLKRDFTVKLLMIQFSNTCLQNMPNRIPGCLSEMHAEETILSMESLMGPNGTMWMVGFEYFTVFVFILLNFFFLVFFN